MGVCFKCGQESSDLVNVVLDEGIVEVCVECADVYEIPFVKEPKEDVLEIANKHSSVYERLSSFAGINPSEHKGFREVKKFSPEKDRELMEFVSKNSNIMSEKVTSYLIRNFHWAIMRARRLRKLTLDEVSEKASIPVSVLKLIESGIVSERNFEAVRKLEVFFGIRVFTDEAREDFGLSNNLSFDSIISRSISVEDLKELQERQEFENFSDEY
ncbi:MAG: hypothetical protein OQK82_06070 [Candidatus Pacearchaeota archaeon]|nr:hypothetical protein [Candidatus Pacearchaeota archaeon]